MAQEEAKQKELEVFEKELEQKYSERMTNERLKVDAAIQRKKELKTPQQPQMNNCSSECPSTSE